MGNWAKDYLKYKNETGGGDPLKGTGGGSGSGPGCGGILLFIFLIWLIVDLLSGK